MILLTTVFHFIGPKNMQLLIIDLKNPWCHSNMVPRFHEDKFSWNPGMTLYNGFLIEAFMNDKLDSRFRGNDKKRRIVISKRLYMSFPKPQHVIPACF